jgi:hypothetical protein
MGQGVLETAAPKMPIPSLEQASPKKHVKNIFLFTRIDFVNYRGTNSAIVIIF